MQSRYVIDVIYMTIIGRYMIHLICRYLIVVKLDRCIDRIQKDRMQIYRADKEPKRKGYLQGRQRGN